MNPRDTFRFGRGAETFVCGVAAGAFMLLVFTALVGIVGEALDYLCTQFSVADIQTSEIIRKGVLLGKSLVISSASATLAAVLGFLCAYYISRFKVRYKTMWVGLLVVPLLIPSHLYCMLWERAAAGGCIPIIRGIPFYGALAVIFVLTLYYMPVGLLCCMLGFSGMERRFEESALLLWERNRVFRRVTLPLMKPYLFAAWIIVFIFTLNEYGVPMLLQVNVFSTELFLQFSELFKPEVAVVESCILLGIVLMTVFGAIRYFARRRYVTLQAADTLIEPCDTATRFSWKYIVLFCLVLLGTLIPLATLLLGVTSPRVFKTTIISASGQIVNSLVYSALTVGIGCIAGFLVACFLQRGGDIRKYALEGTGFFILAVPSMITGIGMILFWNHSGFRGKVYSSIFIVVLGLLIKYLPLMTKAVSASMARRSPAFDEAGEVSGLSFLRRWYHITIPLNIRGILLGCILLFVLTINELNLAVLLTPPGKATLSIRLFTLMHFAPDNVLMSLGLSIVIINILFCAGVLVLLELSRTADS